MTKVVEEHTIASIGSDRSSVALELLKISFPLRGSTRRQENVVSGS